MSESLDYSLEQIEKSINSISTLYFKPPGIFQNSMVYSPNKDYVDIITHLIRDGNKKDELSLYELDLKGQPRRKDGRNGVYDYLIEREVNVKRNRSLGLPEKKPIIHIPKQFYLKQHDEQVNHKKQKTMSAFFIDTHISNKIEGVFNFLLNKFQNDNSIKALLYAMQNGSVITMGEEDSKDSKRRKTVFVEDFPVNLLLRVLEEVITQWPIDSYITLYKRFNSAYEKIKYEIIDLQEEIKAQEHDLQFHNPSIANLIKKEQEEVSKLEQELQTLKQRNQISYSENDAEANI